MNASIVRQMRTALAIVMLMLVTRPPAVGQTSPPRPDVPAAAIEQQVPQGKPLPVGWKITIVALGAMGTGFAIAFAMRAWRSSNLFDRQYRFPAVPSGEQRLGANKSGGFMATIEFRHPK
jgi:hypothetical protein